MPNALAGENLEEAEAFAERVGGGGEGEHGGGLVVEVEAEPAALSMVTLALLETVSVFA